MKKIIVFFAAFLGWVMYAQGVVSPSSVMVKVYEMRVSRNSNCSGATSVFNTASPTAVNLFASPGFGSAVISTGTYHCVMFHISDFISFTPQTTEGTCVAGTAINNFDIFQSGNGQPDSIDPNGMHIIASAGPTEDRPWIYFSDAASAAATQAPGPNLSCVQPTPGTSNACLMAPFNVFSDQSRSLVLDFDNQIGPFGGPCTAHAPTLSVR
jgi:hypothetical protein